MSKYSFPKFTFVLILSVMLSVILTASVCATGPNTAKPDSSASPPSPSVTGTNNTLTGQAIIIDHNNTDITAIPQSWIETAKQSLHIAYGHTSHGSQLTNGMTGLVAFANGGGRGLALPEDILAWNNGGADGALDLHNYAMGGDVGYYPQWVNNTRSYLGEPDLVTGRGTNHSDVNVIIWSWCGQASGYSEQDMIDLYLSPMAQLEVDYPGTTFVYMTGHSDGSGETGNLHVRNQQIRDYAIQNNKVLYDFYDIEMYDPDENYYGDKIVNDNCDYDSDANGSRDSNWALDWQGSHTQDTDWYSCGCAHSQSLNCNQKAYAAWWLWTRIAGWDGNTPSALTLSATPANGSLSLRWTVSGSIPITSTWRINYIDEIGSVYLPVTGLTAETRAHTLTGLSNGIWYTATLNAMLDGSPFLTDTTSAMPVNNFVYLPIILK